MADQRKSFRPRRLAFGGRNSPLAFVLGASFAFFAAITPAQAESDGLKNGAASLAAGKYDAAVRQLSSAIDSDNVSPSEAAKALYLRGLAYRKMGETARAAADLGAAIWLGLPESDKVKALVNRGLAYQAAGLSKEGEAELAAARKIGGSGTVETLIAEGGGLPTGTTAIAAFSTEVRPEESSAASSANVRPRAEPVPSFSTSVTGGEAPLPPQAGPPATRTAEASPTGWSTSVADESQAAGSNSGGGNRLTRWFGSLTDSSSSSASAPEPPVASASPPPQTTQVPRQAPQPSAATASASWSTTTESEVAAASQGASGESGNRLTRLFDRTAEADPQVQPAATQKSAGAYRLQLATSRSEEEAKALWKKVSQSQTLPGIQPEIERVEIGSFGTFYALRIGPFPDKSESLKVCNALKRSGIDCSPAEQ
jgi:cell division septation protein DedD